VAKIGEYLNGPTDLPYVADGVQLWGRAILLLPYFSHETTEWFGFFQRPDKLLQRIALVDVFSGAFLALRLLRLTRTSICRSKIWSSRECRFLGLLVPCPASMM